MLLAAYQPIGLSSASINFFKAYIRPNSEKIGCLSQKHLSKILWSINHRKLADCSQICSFIMKKSQLIKMEIFLWRLAVTQSMNDLFSNLERLEEIVKQYKPSIRIGRFYTPIFDTSHCNVLSTHHDIAAVIYEDECFDDFSNHCYL